MGAAHRGEGDGELGVVRGGPEVADRQGGADVHGRRGGVDGGGSGSLQQEPVAVENDDEGDRLVGSFWRRGEAPVHGIAVDAAATTLAMAEQHNCSHLKAKCVEFIISTPAILDAVVATEGYKHLETSCPAVLTSIVLSMRGRN